jgi:hypothetical protein
LADIGESEVNRLLGGADTVLTNLKIGIKQDEQTLNNLKIKFHSIRMEAEGIAKALKEAGASAEALQNATQGTKTGTLGSIGGTKVAGGTFTPTPIDKGVGGTTGGRFKSWLNMPLGGQTPEGGIGLTRGAAIGQVATFANQAFNQTMGAIDARVDRNREYSLAADRTSVLFQQMKGMSQVAVQNTYRQPLTNYRLGAGGINALMGLEAQTGISGRQQASSVEALRTISGFTLGGQEAVGMINQLASPDVVNRMFMMTGQSLIGPGGKQRSMMDLMQGLVRTTGLSDPRILKGALAPGSVTRANLAQMGITGDMQTQLIQYAMENQTFKEKGGKGMYDPSKKEDRKRMGIEDNFATQAEETDRLRTRREENFYSRQADNFADLEQQTQKLVKVMGKFEDVMSGIIGARTSNRIGMKVGTGLGLGIGALFGQPVLGALAGNFIGGMFGDGSGVGNDSGGSASPTNGASSTPASASDLVTIPYGDGSQRITISELRNKPKFKRLNSRFQEQLINMFVANPNVGFGGGFRTEQEQESGFLKRYRPTDKETNIFWNDKYWEKINPGDADMAPPGRSMHEVGLAADLVGDIAWVTANAAKFGLIEFSKVNDEPWHVQPAGVPTSRRGYEAAGSPWGMPEGVGPSNSRSGTTPNTPTTTATFRGGSTPDYSPVEKGSSGFSLATGTISQKVKSRARVKGGSVGYPTSRSRRGRSSGAGNSSSTSDVPTGGGSLSGQQVAQFLYNAGFRGQDLVNALAISWRESRWNPRSFTSDDDDLSYGLMQINMIPGATNPEGNRSAWGISNNEALFDPATNARIAFEKYKWNKGHGRDPFQDWSFNGSPLNGTNTIMPEATRIIQEMGKSGDPMGGSTRAVGGSTNIVGGHTITISPTIQIMSGATPADIDLERLAQRVGVLLEREVNTRMLRRT